MRDVESRIQRRAGTAREGRGNQLPGKGRPVVEEGRSSAVGEDRGCGSGGTSVRRGFSVRSNMASLNALKAERERGLKAYSDKLKSENDAIFQKVSPREPPRPRGRCSTTAPGAVAAPTPRARACEREREREREELTRPPFFLQYAKLKKFVKDQKKRTKKVSKKHEWTQRKSRLQQDA